jgi:UDPglucose--hexose-1-phosphate uridylyltransferase
MGRPWQGETGNSAPAEVLAYDPACYLCAGNTRVGGVVNPAYAGVWEFDNDFPALLGPDEESSPPVDNILIAEPETGVCRVICYTPDHSKTMASMTRAEIVSVVEVWTTQWQELSARPDLASVTIFENRGAMMGASNPHPHGQIWATSSVPNELATEVERQAAWFDKNGSPLLSDYLDRELADGSRILCANNHFVALVPFWAAWPFETLVLPRRPVAALDELSEQEQTDLADILRRLTASFDRLFAAPFPYTMGLHQRPTQAPAPGFVFHMHFYPPLLRSATVRKFMVGFEMLAMAQRDLTPEAAAERLRAVWVD